MTLKERYLLLLLQMKSLESSILAFVDSPADSQVIQGYQFLRCSDEHQLGDILLAKAKDDVYMVGKLAASRSRICLLYYEERFDKITLLKPSS